MNLPIQALILFVVCVGMPLGFAWWVWRLDERTRAGWLVVVATMAVFMLLVLLVGRWDILGHYTRFVLLALLAAVIFLSWRRHAKLPWRAPNGPSLWRSHWTTLLSLILFAAATVYVAAGLVPPSEARSLTFPLEGGRFMVGQGGDNTFLNYHHPHPAQRYAADITAINAAGFRASTIQPDDLARYVVYGAAVVSPCDGQVMRVRDGLPDLSPPESDPENPGGNHVVIACDDIEVELAHLQNGSIEVETGDRLAAGQRVAAVGNSGNTTEPHLHIHAVNAQGAGVPITFEGVFPVRNRIFRR